MRNGELRRGWMVMLGVVGLYAIGLLMGGLDCVDRREDFLWFLAQCGAGPVAFATDSVRNFMLASGRFDPDTFKGFGAVADVGTLCTAMAGLMNVTAVLDALRGQRRDG